MSISEYTKHKKIAKKSVTLITRRLTSFTKKRERSELPFMVASGAEAEKKIVKKKASQLGRNTRRPVNEALLIRTLMVKWRREI